MKKILLNNQIRVFQIITSTNEQFFCNLYHIPSIIKENNLIDGYYKVYHFWDNKAKLISKKDLDAIYIANNVDKNALIQSIRINGYLWFDKVNGNTYHSVYVSINNDLVLKKCFVYGYGDYYVTTGLNLVMDNFGFNSEDEVRKYITDNCVDFNYSHIKCNKKSELNNI